MSAPLALGAKISLDVGAGRDAFHLEAELSLEAGVLVLFGPSGVGKTLTLKALAGLVPGRGHVRVAGRPWLDTVEGVTLAPHERRVGYVPQDGALFPFLDVAANVAFGLPRALRKTRRVTEWLDALGVAHLASRKPGSLSGGEIQRVALARALAIEPRLLLLDEPFASLDLEATVALRALVRETLERLRIPAVLVTHDANDAIAMGDRLVRFARGRTVEVGAPEDILRPNGGVLDTLSEPCA